MAEEAPNDPLRGHPSSQLPSAADVAAAPDVARDIDGRADIGHVNLTVSDLERSLAFYHDVIGLDLTQRDEQSAFLAAGGHHHHVAFSGFRTRPLWRRWSCDSCARGTSSAARPTTA
jgi:catechol-2,3-dioxygenase